MVGIHDISPAQLIFERFNARLQHSLILAGRVIFGILAEISQGPRGRHPLSDFNHFRTLHAVEISLEFFVSFSRHGNPLDGHSCTLLEKSNSWKPQSVVRKAMSSINSLLLFVPRSLRSQTDSLLHHIGPRRSWQLQI